ncbi:hypothetical protein IAR50_002503 [Cryptococcus sp. DSM 104548]
MTRSRPKSLSMRFWFVGRLLCIPVISDVRGPWTYRSCDTSRMSLSSAQGERDLPSMLGGGDLDGDDYTLIWGQRSVQSLEVYNPMDYTAPEPVSVREVTQRHLKENFVQYILNDVPGQVDNCQLALSDKYTPFDQWYLELSEIHSVSCQGSPVDFAKTGQPALLDPYLRPKERPDFKGKAETYESKNILGKIFDWFTPTLTSLSAISSAGLPARLPDLQYNVRRYRVFEPELSTGVVIRNQHRKRAHDQRMNIMREAAANIARDFSFKAFFTPMTVIAHHCYALTFEKRYVTDWEQQQQQGYWRIEIVDDDEEKDMLRSKPLMSFAWCFWQELMQIVSEEEPSPDV